MFVPPPNSDVKTLLLNVMVLRDGAFGSWSGVGENMK